MARVRAAYHFVLDCPLNAERRLRMTDMIDRLTENRDCFGWRRMSWDQKFRSLLGDGPKPSDEDSENGQCRGIRPRSRPKMLLLERTGRDRIERPVAHSMIRLP